jgi:hypothetical protein
MSSIALVIDDLEDIVIGFEIMKSLTCIESPSYLKMQSERIPRSLLRGKRADQNKQIPYHLDDSLQLAAGRVNNIYQYHLFF